jgi:hypothetical protein
MLVVSLGRSLLTTIIVVSAGCSDLNLRRGAEGALPDTTAEAASAPKPSASRKKATPGTAEAEAAGFADIRRTLRRVVAGEEAYFAENGTYTDDLSVIRLKPDKNVTVRFLWLSREGWAASGTHTALPDKDCVIFVGQAQAPPTTLKYVRPGRVGIPVCDDKSVPTKPSAAPPPKAAAPPEADTASALDLVDPRIAMKVDLRNLAQSQATYLAMQGTYARRTETMALQYLWHRDVNVTILSADAHSWAAKATHAKFPGKSCVIWFGLMPQRPSTDAQQRGEKQPGVPVCDE